MAKLTFHVSSSRMMFISAFKKYGKIFSPLRSSLFGNIKKRCPLIHHKAPLVQEVTPLVGANNRVWISMGQTFFSNVRA
jgi:hypothetical protein